QFVEGENRQKLSLTGFEAYDIEGIAEGLQPGKKLKVSMRGEDSAEKTFNVITRIDTPNELDYYRHDGILQYVLRLLLKN
ncbi:MAG: hypothetical protein V3U69_01030, partial [Bacteroidota bacterium]